MIRFLPGAITAICSCLLDLAGGRRGRCGFELVEKRRKARGRRLSNNRVVLSSELPSNFVP
jgi:hypothetical protein